MEFRVRFKKRKVEVLFSADGTAALFFNKKELDKCELDKFDIKRLRDVLLYASEQYVRTPSFEELN